MSKKRREWLQSAKYLPEPLRDFHDQKDVFKAIHRWASEGDDKPPFSWVDAHIYTIDVFLAYMAQHGYTLQRSRARFNFNDLAESIKVDRNARIAQFATAINNKPPRDAGQEG